MKRIATILFSLSLAAQNLQAQSQAAVCSNNSFGWSLFHEIQKTEPQERNILFSPLSAWLALTLAGNGSDGSTREEFTHALAQEGWSKDEANQAVRLTLDSLLSHPESTEKLKIANAIWVNSDLFELAQDFASDAETYYSIIPDDDIIRNEPFSDATTLDHINEWVSHSTDGLIPSILDDLKADMASILLNALYFEGQWFIPFSSDLTQDWPFYRHDGKVISVKMMQEKRSRYDYAENAHYKMLSLAFRSGSHKSGSPIRGHYRLDLILPIQGSLTNLSQADYESLVKSLSSSPVIVGLPRFRFDFSKSLIAGLQAIGLHQAFTPGQADFTALGQAIKGSDLYLSDVLQKTAADMDENGFKAAAVTAVIVSTTGAQVPEENREFIADQPFFLALRDSASGLVLFQGFINDPKE